MTISNDLARSKPAGPGAGAASRNTSGLVAMILGIAGLLIGGPVFGIPAILLGRKGRRLARAGLATNHGQATAGLVMGWIPTGAFLFIIALLVLRLIVGSLLH